MALQAAPPYKHSVRLKGELVKHWGSKDENLQGCWISLHHGNEVYKVFLNTETQTTEAVAKLVGGRVEVWASKDRKVGGWVARTAAIYLKGVV